MPEITDNCTLFAAQGRIRVLSGGGEKAAGISPAAGFHAQAWMPDGSAQAGKTESSQVVMVIPLKGLMRKYGTWYSYGTMEIAEFLRKAASDSNVLGVVLDIDSQGGYINSISPLTEAIEAVRAAGKPIVAHADACYSAAYWVASQCDAIFLDNQLSGCGSIGAYCELYDDREDKLFGTRRISVYAPESKDKNLAVREALDGKTETMEKELSDLVGLFREAVMKGRPALKEDSPGVMSGGDFLAAEALAAGLCDGMMNLAETIQAVSVRAEFGNK